MPFQIDLAIAVGIFLIFLALFISFILSYHQSTGTLVLSSELRTAASNIFQALFSSPGVPSNWEEVAAMPIKLGLVQDLHRITVLVKDLDSMPLSNSTINFTIEFDFSCAKKAWETTIRIYNASMVEHPYTLYNTTYCSSKFINKTDIVMNISQPANYWQTFYIYFSSDKGINATSYSRIQYPTATDANLSITVFPPETFRALSFSKLKKLRTLDFERVVERLGINFEFRIEVRGS
jgi:hypothetical protein